MKNRRKTAICDDCEREFIEQEGIVRKEGKTQCGRCLNPPLCAFFMNREPLNPWRRAESVFTGDQASPKRTRGGSQ
jgi:hypothetical protein